MKYLIEWNAIDKISDPIPWKYNPNCKCKNFTNYVLLNKNQKNNLYNTQSFCKKCVSLEYLELLDINISKKNQNDEIISSFIEKQKLKKYWNS